MKVREFIQDCITNLDIDADMDFYIAGTLNPLRVANIGMNADIDDPANKNRGGITFVLMEDK